MKHFPFLHQWKIVKVEQYNDISFGVKRPLQMTEVYWVCKCGKAEIQRKSGWWTKEELEGKR